MNEEIDNVIMLFRFDIHNESHNFSLEQKSKLTEILDEADNIDLNTKNLVKLSKNILKLKKVLEKYESTFKSFGGNLDKLEEKLKSIKKEKLKAVAKMGL